MKALNVSQFDREHPDGARTMKRFSQLYAFGSIVVLIGVGLAVACNAMASTGAAKGMLAVELTDGVFPTDSVRRMELFVVRVDARLADADSTTTARGAPDDSANTGGWITIATPNRGVNLLDYQNGTALLLGNRRVVVGHYLGFRVVIDPTRSKVTLKNGAVLNGSSTQGVGLPSESRMGFKVALSQAVSVASSKTTTLSVDFLAGNRFVTGGNSIDLNGLRFAPVLRGSVRQ